jgi:hypothetical protein
MTALAAKAALIDAMPRCFQEMHHPHAQSVADSLFGAPPRATFRKLGMPATARSI